MNIKEQSWREGKTKEMINEVLSGFFHYLF